MSKSKLGLRQAGTAGAVVALTLGVAGLTAGPASAAAGDFNASGTPTIQRGTTAPGGDLTYEFNGTFTTNSTVTFTVADTDGNGCATGAQNGIAFASTPVVTVTPVTLGDAAIAATASAPTGSTTQCVTVGVKDMVTVSLNGGQPSSATGEYNLKLSGVNLAVGNLATPGADVVTAAFDGITPPTSSTTTNATVSTGTFAYTPRTGSTISEDNGVANGSTNNALGTITYKDTNGANFAPTVNTKVMLSLDSGAKFTAGVTPTINVPSGYTVNKDNAAPTPTAGTPAEDGGSTYTFYVKAPATVTSPATITVSGLRSDAGNTPAAVTLTSTLPGSTSTVDAINQVDTTRTGGANRYATAAALYQSQFGDSSNCNTGDYNSVVLSGGQLAPDALSANYLASKIDNTDIGSDGSTTVHGGTLLTPTNSLSPDARREIVNNCIGTVYITGGTAAVSQSVQDQITSMFVGGAQFNPHIQVVRLEGANRYGTNSAINRNQLQNSPTVIVANGSLPYDALAVGPVVYANQDALVLTNGQNFTNDESSQLADLNAKNVVIVGGTAVVSSAVQSQISNLGYNVVRIQGANRGETAAQIATWGTQGLDFNGDGDTKDGALEGNQGLNSSTTDITDGQGFADALSDGPVAGAQAQPILLAQDASTVGTGLTGYLNGKTVGSDGNTTVDTLKAIGLQGATSNALIRAASAEIGTQPPTVTTNPVVIP